MENAPEKNDNVSQKVVVVKYNDYHSLKTLCERQQKDQKTKPTEISRNATPKNVSVISKVSNRVITSPKIYPLYTPIKSNSKFPLSQTTRSYKGPNGTEKKNVTIKGKLLDRSTSLSKNNEKVLGEENIPISINKTQQQEAIERRNEPEIPTTFNENYKENEEKVIEPIEKEEEITRAQKYLESILISDSPENKLFTREELKEIPEKIFESPIKHLTEESDLKNLCIKNEDLKPLVSECSMKIQNQIEASESKEAENFLVADDKKNVGLDQLDLNLEYKTPLKEIEMSEEDAKVIKQMDEFILQIEGENAFLKIKTEDESNKENLDFPRDVIEKIVESIYSNILPEDLAELNQCLSEIKQVAQLEKFEDTTKQNGERSFALNVSKKDNVEFEETLKTETSENGEENIIGFIPQEVDTLEKLVQEIGINTEREETAIRLNGFEDDRLGSENIKKSEPLTYLIENTIDQEAASSESIIDSKYYIVDSISNDSPTHVNIIQQYEPFIYLQEDTSHQETPTSDSLNDLNSFENITNSNTLPGQNLITTVANTKAIETFTSDECSVVIINDGFFLPIDIEDQDPNISQSVSEDRGTHFSKEAGQFVANKPDKKAKRVSKEMKKRELLMLLEQARAAHSILPENCEEVEFKKYNLKSLFSNIKEHIKVAKKLYEKLEMFAESATRSINRSLEAEELNTLQGDFIFMKNLIEKTFVKEETKKPKYKVINITKRDDHTKSILTSNKSLSKKVSGSKTIPKASRQTSDKALHQTLNRMNKILDVIEQNDLLSKCVKQSSKKNSTCKSKGRDKSSYETNGFETEEETQDLEIISDDSESTIPKKSSGGLNVCDKSVSVVLNRPNSNFHTDIRHGEEKNIENELDEENSAKTIYQDKEFRKSELQSKIKRKSEETLEKSKSHVGKGSYHQIKREEDTILTYKNEKSPRYYLRSQKLNPFAKGNYSKDKLKNKKELGYDVDYSSVIPLDKIGSPSCNYTLTNDNKPCIVLYNKKCEPQKSIFRNPFAKLEKRYFTRNSWKDILECETTERYSLRSRTLEKRESFLERLSSKA